MVFDNPFADDTTPEYELLDLPENIGAFGSINPDTLYGHWRPDASNETIHFYATGHLDAPPLRQADVPSPCNGDGGTRGFRSPTRLFRGCLRCNIYAANIDTSTGFLEPSPDRPSIRPTGPMCSRDFQYWSIDGDRGNRRTGKCARKRSSRGRQHRVIPLPNPAFYIETRQSG